MGRKKSQKGGGKKKNANADFLKGPEVLQAVVLADSFTVKLQPVTLEQPKVLLPLGNVPMINYALEFLESNGAQEIFVVASSKAALVKAYLEKSKWLTRSHNCKVEVIVSKNAYSAGDALRDLAKSNLIQHDFILISGDVVSNIKLNSIIEAHKKRVEQDERDIMTIVTKKAASNHRTRSLDDDLVVAVDRDTSQLLVFSNEPDESGVEIDKTLIEDCNALQVRYDLMDTHIDICSPEVLELFEDNFDWGDIREDFVGGVLGSEILGNRIFTHVVEGQYAARIKDWRTYDSVSRDVLQRWTYPIVPDNNMFDTRYQYKRGNIYRELTETGDSVSLSRTSVLERNTMVGAGSRVGNNSSIISSTVGRNCVIGDNVRIEDSYIWDNVTIEDGVVIENGVIASNCSVYKGAVISKGTVLSFGVIVGAGITTPEYSKFTTLSEADQDGDDEDDFFDGDNETTKDDNDDISSEGLAHDAEAVGEDGCGRHFEVAEEDEDVHHYNSIAPDLDAWEKERKEIEDEADALAEFDEEVAFDDMKEGAFGEDRETRFIREMKETVCRGIEGGFEVDAITLEVASLKLSHDATIEEHGRAVAVAFLSAVKGDTNGLPVAFDRAEQVKLVAILKQWNPLLKKYAEGAADQRYILNGIETACLDPSFTGVVGLLVKTLYDLDVIDEEVVLEWAADKDTAIEEDTLSPAHRLVYKHVQPFVEWLQAADEESSEEESESD